MMRKPPRFAHGYVDRHGKPRWYLRRRGCPNIPLPGLPWSPEFMAAYETALNGQGAAKGNRDEPHATGQRLRSGCEILSLCRMGGAGIINANHVPRDLGALSW
jgi:hypothetical protein